METTLEKVPINESQPNRLKANIECIRKLFLTNYWPWLLLAFTIGIIFWLTPILNEAANYIRGLFAYFIEDATAGWNMAAKDSKSGNIDVIVPYSFPSVVAGIVGLLTFFWFSIAAIWIHYKFLYSPLVLKSGLSYILLYLFWLLLFWRGLVFFFNSFKPEFDSQSIAFATFTTALCILFAFGQSYRQNQRQKLILIQQRTQAELDALKAQVNPHFLFNSLNNIYGTAMLEDSPRTAESIQQLSGIVRYVMEESRLQTTDIQRELRFIDDFVELQRIRLPNQDNIEIKTDIEWDEKPAQIVPLLLNPLIENAFKYGISIQHPCFVHIRLRVQEGMLHLTTENSILTRTDLEKGTGLGLANVRQRLMLAYSGRHTLTVSEQDDTFLVNLTINLRS